MLYISGLLYEISISYIAKILMPEYIGKPLNMRQGQVPKNGTKVNFVSAQAGNDRNERERGTRVLTER